MKRAKLESTLSQLEADRADPETVTVRIGIRWIDPVTGEEELEPEKTYTWKVTEPFTKWVNQRARHRVFR